MNRNDATQAVRISPADESLSFIAEKTNSFRPQTAIILGTGLGGLVKEVDVKYSLDYSDIPHFPVSTVESHTGKLIFAEIASRRLVIMQGRFHFYEGYSMEQITYPIMVMRRFNISELFVSNVSGAVNPMFEKGDIMIIRDHINFLFRSPISSAQNSVNKIVYDAGLIEMAEQTALENNLKIRKGIYCTLSGPNLETRSEYRLIRKMGADVVGMSTVPETLLSSFLGLKVFGISIITDAGFPDNLKPVVLAEVLQAAADAEPKLTVLIKKMIWKLT